MDTRNDTGGMTARFWCVVDIPASESRIEHEACIVEIEECARFLHGSVHIAEVARGASLYIEFEDLEDLIAFRLVESRMTVFGVDETVTWV